MPIDVLTALRQKMRKARKNKELTKQKPTDLSHVSVKQIANIENKGQHLSVQIFLELMSCYHISMEQILHDKATERMQFETLLDTRTRHKNRQRGKKLNMV